MEDNVKRTLSLFGLLMTLAIPSGLLAQQTGAWSRLKLCRESGCRSAFYDTSRNGSGVWHNVRSCGNIANLQTSRARKKTRTAAHSGSGNSTQQANPPRTAL